MLNWNYFSTSFRTRASLRHHKAGIHRNTSLNAIFWIKSTPLIFHWFLSDFKGSPPLPKEHFFAVAANGRCCVFIPKSAMKMFSFCCMWLMPKRDQWPVSNCSNKRSFQKQINQQISWRPTLSIWGEFGTVSPQLYLLLRQRTSFHRKDSRFF